MDYLYLKENTFFMPENENLRRKQQEPLRILLIAASTRQDSLNMKLAAQAGKILSLNGAIADLKSIAEFDCASFSQDLEKNDGIPIGATRLKNSILANDAFIIASPEYNASMPGHLKNVI